MLRTEFDKELRMVLDEPSFTAYNKESLIYHVPVRAPCGTYIISIDEDEVLRALLNREQMD